MKHRYISLSLACLFLVACDAQQPNIALPEKPEIKKQTETKPASSKPGQSLDLSIDNITIEDGIKADGFLNENSDLFNKLSKKPKSSELSISGDLLTDKDKANDGSYLKSVDGAHINIKGSFD